MNSLRSWLFKSDGFQNQKQSKTQWNCKENSAKKQGKNNIKSLFFIENIVNFAILKE